MLREKITLFTPLAGKFKSWTRFSKFLERQTYPHHLIKLILTNTSHVTRFGNMVKSWLKNCGYEHIYLERKTLKRNLAHLPRQKHEKLVHMTLTPLYREMTRLAKTDFIWLMDDDTIPILPNACEKLMQGFTERKVFSVSAAYKLHAQRWHPNNLNLQKKFNYYSAWLTNESTVGKNFLTGGEGFQIIKGNGTGCVLLRYIEESNYVYNPHLPTGGDQQFYWFHEKRGRIAKINWDVKCNHICEDKTIFFL